jgi:hypothetical protein
VVGWRECGTFATNCRSPIARGQGLSCGQDGTKGGLPPRVLHREYSWQAWRCFVAKSGLLRNLSLRDAPPLGIEATSTLSNVGDCFVAKGGLLAMTCSKAIAHRRQRQAPRNDMDTTCAFCATVFFLLSLKRE